MDSLWRFGTIDIADQQRPARLRPEACKVMKIYYDLSNPVAIPRRLDELSMTGTNRPNWTRNRLTIGPVEARDADGSVLLMVEGGVCRRLGEVRNGF